MAVFLYDEAGTAVMGGSIGQLKVAWRFLGHKYELSREDYLGKNLRFGDARALLDFVNGFSDITKQELTVIAVGSSTYSKRIRRRMERLREDYPYLDVSTRYNDIDLRIYPEAEGMPLDELEGQVADALKMMGMPYTRYVHTKMGYPIVRSEYGSGRSLIKTLAPFYEYDPDSISLMTRLKTETPLELILGKEDPIFTTGTKKIRSERKNNTPFVLLMRGYAGKMISDRRDE